MQVVVKSCWPSGTFLPLVLTFFFFDLKGHQCTMIGIPPNICLKKNIQPNLACSCVQSLLNYPQQPLILEVIFSSKCFFIFFCSLNIKILLFISKFDIRFLLYINLLFIECFLVITCSCRNSWIIDPIF